MPAIRSYVAGVVFAVIVHVSTASVYELASEPVMNARCLLCSAYPEPRKTDGMCRRRIQAGGCKHVVCREYED